MPGTIRIKLTTTIILRLSHCYYIRKYGLKCYKCRREFKIGETIVSKGHPRKYHCLTCAKALHLI